MSESFRTSQLLSITAKDLSNVISKEKSLSEKNPMDEIIENLYLGDWEDALLKDGKKVLLHCGAGIERSPLACVWFLHTKRNMDFDEAYEFVKEKRPIVADRRTWLGK